MDSNRIIFLECIESGKIDENFRVQPKLEDLYDYVRLKIWMHMGIRPPDWNGFKVISADGPFGLYAPGTQCDG